MTSGNLGDLIRKFWDDPRVTTKHISLYLALFGGMGGTSVEPVVLNRGDLMRRAKISGKSTYYRCLRELHEQGYISYRPARHRWDDSVALPNIHECLQKK
jgi:hypothetical protein